MQKLLRAFLKARRGVPAQAPRADICAIRAAPKCRLRTQHVEPEPEPKPSFEKGPKCVVCFLFSCLNLKPQRIARNVHWLLDLFITHYSIV